MKREEQKTFNLDPKIVENRTNKKQLEKGDQLKKNQEARKVEEKKREKQDVLKKSTAKMDRDSSKYSVSKR